MVNKNTFFTLMMQHPSLREFPAPSACLCACHGHGDDRLLPLRGFVPSATSTSLEGIWVEKLIEDFG